VGQTYDASSNAGRCSRHFGVRATRFLMALQNLVTYNKTYNSRLVLSSISVPEDCEFQIC
jgi:hypothetical protein